MLKSQYIGNLQHKCTRTLTFSEILPRAARVHFNWSALLLFLGQHHRMRCSAVPVDTVVARARNPSSRAGTRLRLVPGARHLHARIFVMIEWRSQTRSEGHRCQARSEGRRAAGGCAAVGATVPKRRSHRGRAASRQHQRRRNGAEPELGLVVVRYRLQIWMPGEGMYVCTNTHTHTYTHTHECTHM